MFSKGDKVLIDGKRGTVRQVRYGIVSAWMDEGHARHVPEFRVKLMPTKINSQHGQKGS